MLEAKMCYVNILGVTMLIVWGPTGQNLLYRVTSKQLFISRKAINTGLKWEKITNRQITANA